MKTFMMLLQLQFTIHVTMDVCSVQPAVKGCLGGWVRRIGLPIRLAARVATLHTIQIDSVASMQRRGIRVQAYYADHSSNTIYIQYVRVAATEKIASVAAVINVSQNLLSAICTRRQPMLENFADMPIFDNRYK